jgi:homoserine O-acetyltransferase
VIQALEGIKAKTLVVGIETDFLFPVSEQKFLAQHIPHAELEIIQSAFGHDGFLVEFDQFKKIVGKFLRHAAVPAN